MDEDILYFQTQYKDLEITINWFQGKDPKLEMALFRKEAYEKCLERIKHMENQTGELPEPGMISPKTNAYSTKKNKLNI